MLRSDSVPTLQLKLLGPPQVIANGAPIVAFRTSKGQALLFYLAVAGAVQRRSTLAALLWPDSSEQQASASLRSALSDLRKLVGAHLTITRHTVHLRQEALSLDVAQFDGLLNRAGDAETRILHMQAAVSLYAGEFLQGFHVPGAPEFEQWITVERERLRQAILHALLGLAAWHSEQQDYAASLDHLTRLLAIEPTNEAGHREKMVVLARMGQRGAALQQYGSCRRVLAEELGIDPSPETTAIHELILSGALSGESETARLRLPRAALAALAQPEPARPVIDWREAPLNSAFFGRKQDLVLLNRWLTRERASLVAITGMGGVGKTTLAVQLIENLDPASYDYMLWRSLVNAPPLPIVLDAWLQAMAEQRLDLLPESMDEKLAVLFAQLQRQRCLLVLDNVESIMQSGRRTGYFRPGYEDYGHLLERMGISRHGSCLLMTSRELPAGLHRLEEDHQRVRIMTLAGLPVASGLELLQHRGVVAPDLALHSLVERYSGNPLALKLAADTVRDLFGNNVDAFLGEEAPVFDDIRSVLDEQFDRLSALEQEMVVWLAIEREPTPAEALWQDLARPPDRRDLVEATRSLRRNALVEAALHPDHAGGVPHLALQSVVIEYVTDRLIQTLRQELAHGQVDWLQRFALVKAHSPEHVQESQRRLLLHPLARWLADNKGRTEAVDHLCNLVARVQQEAAHVPSYAGANLLHLLLHLEADVKGLDLSHLAIWQADLRTASLLDVNLQDADLRGTTFADSFGAVVSLGVSPDGHYLATGGSDGRVFVWQMADYQPHLVLAGHMHGIGSVAWSPDSKLLASGSYDGQVRLWDVRTGQLAGPWQSYPETIAAVAWHPDGVHLASAGAGNTIVVTDVQRNSAPRHLPQQAWVNGLAFSPDGTILASGNDAGEVHLWDWRTGDLLHTLRGHTDKVRAVAFSTDGTLFASGGEDGRICLRRVADPGAYRVLAGHTGWVLSLAWSPDGTKVASASADRSVRLWDIETGRVERTLLGHSGWAAAVAYSPDGATVVSGGYDQSVRLWDARRGHLVHRLHGTIRWVSSVRFSPDGSLLATSGLDGPVRLWEVSSGRRLHTLRGHHGAVRATAFSRQAGLLVGACDDHQAYVWDTTSGNLRRVLRGHTGMVRSVAFSPTGSTLATGSYDGTVRLWNAASGQLLRIVPDANAIGEFALTWSANGELLAYPGAHNTVEVLHAGSGQVTRRLPLAQEHPMVAAHSPQGSLLACGTQEGAVWLWEVPATSDSSAAALRFRTQPGGQKIFRLLWSPDSRWLAAYDEGNTLHLIDPARGSVVYALTGVPTVFSLAFDRGGNLLMTGEAARHMVVRDAATGEVLRILGDNDSEITSVDASPHADLLASSTADGVVRLWALETDECLATLAAEGPYAGMNITGATGMSATQQATLLTLGAVMDSEAGSDVQSL